MDYRHSDGVRLGTPTPPSIAPQPWFRTQLLSLLFVATYDLVVYLCVSPASSARSHRFIFRAPFRGSGTEICRILVLTR